MDLRRVKRLVIAAATVGLVAFEAFRHLVLHPLERVTTEHVTEHFISAGILLVGVVAFSLVIFRILERINGQLVVVSSELAAERERGRIGMDLHDGVIQRLYALRLQVEDAAELAATDPQQAGRTMREAQDALGEAIADMRTYVYGLQDGDGSVRLGPALEHLAAEFRSDRPPIVLDLAADPRIPAHTATNAIQVVREAVANAIRHAGASRVTIATARDGDCLALMISDDGVGFDPDSTPTGLGIPNMRERARGCACGLEIRSAPHGGTTVRLCVPVPVETREEASR